VRNVVLTGFMGTGKSTVGRLLAERLGYEFVDTDALIEQRHGSIPEIFAEHGEETFRRYEREVAHGLAHREGLVIATGGRMMLDPGNAELLGSTGDVFCLVAKLATIVGRVTAAGAAERRPLLAGSDVEERIALLMEERSGGYARFVQIPTDERSPVDIADEIIDRLAADAIAEDHS
jgi:shikimate kinase